MGKEIVKVGVVLVSVMDMAVGMAITTCRTNVAPTVEATEALEEPDAEPAKVLNVAAGLALSPNTG